MVAFFTGGWYQFSPMLKDYLYNTAETIPGSSTDRLAAKAKELNMYVIFGMTEKVSEHDSLYNTSVFLGPSGIIGKYRKMNLWEGGNEHLCWKKGKNTGVFDSPFGKVGLMICIDMHYWLGLELAKEGANFLVTVSAWPASAKERFEKVTKENAAKTNLWHIVSNQVGSVGDIQDYGHSRIVDPNGNIIADTGDEEGLIIVKTDLLVDLKFLKDK
ncbi:Aliphatic amidase [subsurface metagenome]